MEVKPSRTVRELQLSDTEPLTNYWLNSDPAYMRSMGVDLAKMPSQEQWQQMLSTQIAQAYTEKQSYALIWELNGRAIGHSNVNKIIYEEEAYLHLHIWYPEHRQGGHGPAFLKLAIPLFFENLQLKRLYCEPYALNPAPNRTLPKLGFSFVKSYVTTPGWINFEQEVNLWLLEK